MTKEISSREAASRFRRKVHPLIVKSDKQGNKKLFVDLTAAACMKEGDSALEDMTGELKEALEEPHHHIRRDLFSRF